MEQFKTLKGNMFPLGASVTERGIQFSCVNSGDDSHGIILIEKKNKDSKTKIPFPEGCRMGNISSMIIEGISASDYTYRYYNKDGAFIDPYSKRILGNTPFGIKNPLEYALSSAVDDGKFDWGEDRILCTPFSESILYLLHVRGFTKSTSSKVKHPGTFQGIIEKIPYLKELGITAIEVLPCYEFEEYSPLRKKEEEISGTVLTDASSDRVNFWGFMHGYYFAPKASYAAGEDPCFEMRTMIKSLHEAGIEFIMQLYFPDDIKGVMIQDVLRHWVLNYHVDGFHLKGNKVPITLLSTDPLLANTKLFYDYIPTEEIYPANSRPKYKNLCVYSDEYMYQMRKFLKADPDMLSEFIKLEKRIPEKTGTINFITNYYGFSLYDLYSYDTKHNEDNKENNRDGCNSNYSWNCGTEGPTRKKSILLLRQRMVKNAILALLFGAGTPLITAGDECLNSLNGNNNAYCQDNETGYVNWNTTKYAKEIFEFTKDMIALRKSKGFLRREEEATLLDPAHCGFPDLSFHQEEAWKTDLSGDKHHIGMMFTETVSSEALGKSANKVGTKFTKLYYVAFNMHWEERYFSMPNLVKKAKWEEFLSTGDHAVATEEKGNVCFSVPARTVIIFEAK